MTMDSIKSCKDYINKLKDEYIESQKKLQERDALIYENHIEKHDIKGYHGREILELLQNADDAYQKSINLGETQKSGLIVSINYKDDILKVTNTGTFFDKEGIKSIVQGNNSTKSGKYIGNKGTGFRSILNWAKEIKIYSGNFNVIFSEDIAGKIFDTLKNEPQIKKQLVKEPNLYIPMLEVPENIEPTKYNAKTTIEIKIDPNKTQDDFSVLKQLENIDLSILLFLPNIEQIDITTQVKDISYKRLISDSDHNFKNITLQKFESGKITLEESFILFNKTIEKALKEDDKLKDILLSIAVPQDFSSFKNKTLYTFFPLLDTTSPFNCVLHASYDLGAQRNTINSNDKNKIIIQEQLTFLVETANSFIDQGKYDIAYKILYPINFKKHDWHFPEPFSKFKLESFYFDLLEKQKLFLTVNNEIISIIDNPKILEVNFPKFFFGEKFKKLLNPIEDKNFLELLEILAERANNSINYDEEELCTIINSLSESWHISEQVEVFIWWNQHYSNLLPYLLKTQESNWLEFRQECYFLTGNTSNIPNWVKVPALKKEYQNELFSQAENMQRVEEIKKSTSDHISRIIVQNNIFHLIDFKYRDRSNIITTVNSSVNDDHRHSIEFVNWLWNNYRNEDQDWNPPGISDNSTKYNFPSKENNGVKDSTKLYFGFEYGNNLSEKLFSISDETFEKFPDISDFAINEKDKENFKEFISKFGVKNFPAIEKQKIEPIEKYKQRYENEIKNSSQFGASDYIYSICFELPYIRNLGHILEKLSMAEIICWILKDDSIYQCLNSTTYSHSEASIFYMGNRQQYNRYYSGTIKNYILEIFNETKWIEINGSRYSPRQVLQNWNAKNNQKFHNILPVLNVAYLEKLAKELNCNFNEIQDIFNKFDFCNKVTDLSSEDFYGLLLRIPTLENFSESVELSKALYRIMENSDFSKEFKTSANKNEFLKNGKVLVKYQGSLKYYNAKESYLPTSKILDKKNFPIVEKGIRTNNQNFIKTFGCKEYSVDYKIIEKSISTSKADAAFQSYFSEFKKYAHAYGERNDNIEKDNHKLKITLVNKISVLENGVEKEITDEYICIRDIGTNWFITIFGTDFEINKLSEIIENIYENIANTRNFDAGKIGEIFRTKNKSDREFLIKKEFGSLEFIEDANYQNEIRNNFIETVKSIAPNFYIQDIDIDFDNFSNIQNVEKLIDLFKKLNVDVNQFKEAGFVYTIDLVSYYKSQLKDFIQNNKRQFKNDLFTKALNNEKLQEKFIQKIDEFEQYSISAEANSIKFDFKKEMVLKFGNWQETDTVFDADKIYARNYEKMNPNKLFEDEIANTPNVQTMIYFGRINQFENWLIELKQKANEENSKKEENLYEPFRNIIPEKQEVPYHEINDSENFISRSTVCHKHSYTNSSAEKRKHIQKTFGNKGELLIFNLLSEKFGKENVFPHSEAFVEMGLLKPGQAASGDYDISYRDKDEIEYFVEVKSSKDGMSFFIAPHELEFAKDNAERYKLYLVTNIDSEKPNYCILPNNFWEDSRYRKTEIIEKIQFDF